MLTSNKSARFVLPLILVGLLSAGIAPQDELQNMRRLLALQEQQLDLLQQQIALTRGRIQALSGEEAAPALIELEAKIVQVTTHEEGEFERLIGLPGQGAGLPLVLDGDEYEALLAKVAGTEGATVVSRPKIAISDGVRGEVSNMAQVPYFDEQGELTFASVGVRCTFRPKLLPSGSMTLAIDASSSVQTGEALVQGVDQTERTVPEISSRRTRTSVQLQKGQGVVLGGVADQNVSTSEIEHLLFFVRTKVLTTQAERDF